MNKFKYERLSSKNVNEEDATLWWTIAKSIVLSNTLPNVCNFYPVVSETTVEISPVQNALNKLSERMEKLKSAYEHVASRNEVDEVTKSLILSTIDSGVFGGLPKYKVGIHL